MKKHFMSLVVMSCVSVFISGCLGGLHRKPIPPLDGSALVIRADESGNISFMGKGGSTYKPCGEGYQNMCPPVLKSKSERLIGTITELEVDKEASSNEGAKSGQRLFMMRSNNSESDCPKVIKIKTRTGVVTFVEECPDR